jgi:hypothetical protein
MFVVEATGRLGVGATTFLNQIAPGKDPWRPSRPMYYQLIKQIGSITAKRNAQAVSFMRRKIARGQISGYNNRAICV